MTAHCPADSGPNGSQAVIAIERVTSASATSSPCATPASTSCAASSSRCSGPSGCGKTTMLRMIAGFEDVTSGVLRLDGVERRRRAALPAPRQHRLPELRALPAPVGLRQRRLRPAHPKVDGGRAARSACARCSRSCASATSPTASPSQLSGGQRQRVALARALVNHPSALLLDEPLSALDLELRRKMQIELKRIQRDVGITFVFVTHDQEEALTMSDRIAVMSTGQLEQVGTPEQIYDHAGDRLRRALHRQRQHDPGRGRCRRRTGARR